MIDRFEPFEGPVEYPEYDLIVEYGIYMSPIDFHVLRFYQSLTNQKLQYDFFIHCDETELKLSEGLPATVLITIEKRIGDKSEVVHTEKWIRKNVSDKWLVCR